MIVVRHAWLQKHPSPAAASGEFHWYPREGDRELRSELVERVRGLEPPAVLWELAPGRVVWARSFAATAPMDGRRYVGLVVTIAESVIGRGTERACDLLRAVDVPAAAPWSSAAPEDLQHAAISEFPAATELDALPRGDLIALARGLLSGGVHEISDPMIHDLSLFVAAIERHVADGEASRRGAWIAGDVSKPDRVATLLAAAARSPTSDEARAWGVLCDLAESRQETPDVVAAALEADPLTDEERAALARHPIVERQSSTLAELTSLTERLHAWGRGRFDLCPTAGSLLDRLADAVALRVLAELASGGDPRRPIAEARWYSLLPAERRTSLLDNLIARAASLRSLVETTHA
jgi:hypothetical protein